MGKTSLDWAHKGKAGATVENRVLRSIVRRACVAIAEDVTIGPAVQRGVVTEEEVVVKASQGELSVSLPGAGQHCYHGTLEHGSARRKASFHSRSWEICPRVRGFDGEKGCPRCSLCLHRGGLLEGVTEWQCNAAFSKWARVCLGRRGEGVHVSGDFLPLFTSRFFSFCLSRSGVCRCRC